MPPNDTPLALRDESLSHSASLAESLSAATSEAYDRSEIAIDKCDFVRSPELRNALLEYYKDHYRLATVLDKVIDQEITERDLAVLSKDKIADNYDINQTAEDLLALAANPQADRVDVLKRVQAITESMLFQEVCVGATTVGKEEVSIVEGIFAKLKATALAEHLTYNDSNGDLHWRTKIPTPRPFDRDFPREAKIEEVISRIETRGTGVWEDSRLAGQMLFHNTPFMKNVAFDAPDGIPFTLRSRSDRLQSDGSFVSGTAEGAPGYEMHTNDPHFCETYRSADYKTQNKTKVAADVTPATIALPLAEIVKIAPYARDCQYGILEVKDSALLEKVPYNDRIVIGGTGFGGNFDIMGESGEDRVFFADKNDPVKGHNYRINLGRIMTPEGKPMAHIIQLQADYMRFGAHEVPDYGVGYGYPVTHRLPYDNRRGSSLPSDVRPGKIMYEYLTPEERLQKLGFRIDSDNTPVANANGSFRPGMTPEQQDVELTQQIKAIMEETKNEPEYRNQVVVPLRQGVMAYANEGGNERYAFGGLGEFIKQSNPADVLHKEAAGFLVAHAAR